MVNYLGQVILDLFLAEPRFKRKRIVMALIVAKYGAPWCTRDKAIFQPRKSASKKYVRTLAKHIGKKTRLSQKNGQAMNGKLRVMKLTWCTPPIYFRFKISFNLIEESVWLCPPK